MNIFLYQKYHRSTNECYTVRNPLCGSWKIHIFLLKQKTIHEPLKFFKNVDWLPILHFSVQDPWANPKDTKSVSLPLRFRFPTSDSCHYLAKKKIFTQILYFHGFLIFAAIYIYQVKLCYLSHFIWRVKELQQGQVPLA